MKIETKLSLNNMKKNIKRTMFTTLSIALCSFLIFTTILIISSIRNGITEKSNIQYNDYHFIIKNLSADDFNKIKNKNYIDKIYIQENDKAPLKQVDSSYTPSNDINVYLKYTNIKDSYEDSTDIVQTLGFSLFVTNEKCEFNENLLMVYGLVGADLDDSQGPLIYKSILNFSYVINIMIILILIFFSILFIIILYNAFLITINERKREYAILNSIGGTEGQILKIIFIEATIMGVIGIVIGFIISIIGAKTILNILNNILASTTFNFKLVIDIKYIILALAIILFNIYISAIIPSVKASSTSVIQNIRSNKQIKSKKRKVIFGRILPIEGRLALINLKRNKNKYRVITILLVICMTSYIAVSTYINYEKESSSLITDYDIDAELAFDSTSNIDYKNILNNYVKNYKDKIEYMECKKAGLFVFVEPTNAFSTSPDNIPIITYKDKIQSQILLVGLDDKTYNKYINKINANYGDYIIYNTVSIPNGEKEITYTYDSIFNTNKLKFSIVNPIPNLETPEPSFDYDIVDDETLKGNFVLTDELIDGYKGEKISHVPIIFVNMNTYNKIEQNIDNYENSNNKDMYKWMSSGISDEPIYVKINCGNIISFSNYIESIKNTQNINVFPNYYSLYDQEKIIYINVIQFILEIIIVTIMIIGIISAINIINASLCERKQEFKILSDLGATNGNIDKILIYECVFMFIKAIIISIILSIPIIYLIIKSMENVIILNKLLIPFGGIALFIVVLLIISLIIMLCSSRNVKNK